MDACQRRKFTIPTIPMIGRLLILSAAFCKIQAQAPGSVWDGAYSQPQAQRGESAV